MSKLIQLRHVPDDLHRKVEARAAMEGLSLSEFLLREVRRLAERPTLAELRGASGTADRREPAGVARAGGAHLAGWPVILVHASAVIELLPNTAAGVRLNPARAAPGRSKWPWCCAATLDRGRRHNRGTQALGDLRTW